MIINGADASNIKSVFCTRKNGSDIQTKRVNMDTLMLWSQQFYGTLRAYYNNKNNNLNPDIFSGANGEKPIARYLWSQSFMTYNNCVGMFGNKKHVLIIPNWKESEQTALYDVENTTNDFDFNNPSHDYAPTPYLIGFFWPVEKKKLEGYHSITVALTSEQSLLRDVYNYYGIRVIDCSKPYSLGEDTYSGFTLRSPPHKFDVIQLLGHDRPPEGTVFRAKDIKDDFKRYCNDDFLLHDFWRPKGTFKKFAKEGNSLYYGIEGTENEEARNNLKELHCWFETIQYGQDASINQNDSDLKTVMTYVKNHFGSNRMLHGDSDFSNLNFVPLEEMEEKFGSFRNTAKKNARTLNYFANNSSLSIF